MMTNIKCYPGDTGTNYCQGLQAAAFALGFISSSSLQQLLYSKMGVVCESDDTFMHTPHTVVFGLDFSARMLK